MSSRSGGRPRDSAHGSSSSRARDKDNHEKEEELALQKFVSDHNLPFLGLCSGFADDTSGEVLPPSSNMLMWPTEMICKLRSEIFRLSAELDAVLKDMENAHKESLQDVVKKMVEMEGEEPLLLRPISGEVEAGLFWDESASRSRSPTPVSEVKPAERRPRMSSERRMSLARPKNDEEDLRTKASLQDSLWNNMDLFLKPVPNLGQFNSVLAPPRGKAFDKSVLSEPFGTHYSVTLPRQVEGFSSDPMKSRLVLPPSVFEESRTDVNTAHLHSRVVCALVRIPLGSSGDTCAGAEDSGVGVVDLRKGNEVLEQLRRSSTRHQTLRNIMDNGTPTPEGMGTTTYGQLSFGEKLRMELDALQISGSALSLADSNCPVMKCMAYHIQQQSKVTEKANLKRKMIAELLKEKRSAFEERVRIKNNWDAALKRFLAQQEVVEAKTKPAKSKTKTKQKKKDRKRDSSDSDDEND